ncbi:MAG: hypothetical protein D6730_22440, partial [Bacteroidetes bacterium]
MSHTRKLAAIMFTDIQGYTALMQQDEAKAVAMRQRHREVFERLHQQYHGTILQYYGDGTLSVFDSAIDAAHCATEMQRELQKEPKVPLRIGIHTGDVMFSDTEVIGDGVNIAARVESVAVPGSVMISEKVYDYIKNQAEMPVASMGRFSFKNVGKPLEVFALRQEGLVIPDPRELVGKFEKRKQAGSWWARLPRPAAYLLGLLGLGLLGLLGYLALSPGQAKATQTIKMKDELGNTIERTIVKADHQKRIYLMNFEPDTTDSSFDWMGVGIPYALETDWDQDPYMLVYFDEDKQITLFNEQLAKAVEFQSKMMLNGSYSLTDSGFHIHPRIYDAQSGQLIKEWDFEGPDFWALLDQAALQIKRDLGVPPQHLNTVRDLPVANSLTHSMEAYRHFCEAMTDLGKFRIFQTLNKLDEAVKTDESFAAANYLRAFLNHQFSISETNARQALDLAMQHRKRLPETMDMNVRMLKYRMDNQMDKAVELGKMMTQLRPNDPNLFLNLAVRYQMLDQYEDALSAIRQYQQLRDDPFANVEIELFCLRRLDRLEEATEKAQAFLKQAPDNSRAMVQLATLYLAAGKTDQAAPLFSKVSLMEPENKNWARFVDHIHFVNDSAEWISSDFLEKLAGTYRAESRQTSIQFQADGRQLYMHLLRQPKLELYPTSTYRFFNPFDMLFHFQPNAFGEIDVVLLSEKDGPWIRLFRQDSL